LLDRRRVHPVAGFLNVLFRLNQMCERGVDHDTHRRIVVAASSTPCDVKMAATSPLRA